MSFNIKKPYNLHEIIQKADAGDPEAMFDAVCAIDIDRLEDHDPEDNLVSRRLSYLFKLSEIEGYENVLITLGTTYEQGKGVQKDAQEAIRWYEKAVEAGIPFGNECIGMIYYTGNGVPVDYKKAYEYFTKDETEVSVCTIYALGEMYRQGLYVEKDLEEALECYEDIVYDDSTFKELDDYYWRACYRLGQALHYGWGTEVDIDEAVDVLNTAKRLFDQHAEKAEDITKEELDQEWMLVNQDAGTCK